MSTRGSPTTSKAKLIATRVATLLIPLAVGLALLSTKPAGADHCDPQNDPGCHVNLGPIVTVDQPSVTVNEGDEATNTGTFKDLNDESDYVSEVFADIGVVSHDLFTEEGNWSWSHTPDDDTKTTMTVTITARDNLNAQHSNTFTLTVDNVAPTATFNAPASVPEGSPINLSLDNPSDPSDADTQAGFSYAFDCGDGNGFGNPSGSSSASCTAGSGPKQKVRAKIIDKDGGENEYEKVVTIDEVAPAGTVTINGGAAVTRRHNVLLTLSASDNAGGSGVKEMRFSNDGVNWSAWQPYATSKGWVLAPGFGVKAVYVEFRDAAGHVSGKASDTILKKKKKKRRR